MATQSGYLDLDGGKLYYEMAGAGDTLVLGHAGFIDSGEWDAQWDALTARYRVIRYDMRGYGRSDAPTGPIVRRDELYQVLRCLEVDTAALLGCSLSGTTMLDFALEHPDMTTTLILVSATPSGFPLQGDPPPVLLEMIGALQQGDIDRASELQIRIWVDGPFRTPEQVNPAMRRHAAAMNRIAVTNNTWALVEARPANPLEPPAMSRLSEVHIPTLIIAGALDHPELLRSADVMASEIAGATKVIIPDAAHVPNMDKPAEFTEAVMAFLDGVKG